MIIELLFAVSLKWGPYTVNWKEVDFGESFDEPLYLSITKGKDTLKLIEVFMVNVKTLDLNGDKVSELIITDYSGGMHCCWTYYVYTRNPELKILGIFDMGNGGLEFEDLNGDGILEAYGSYDGFEFYDIDLCHAGTPYFPIVFSLKDGKYVENTLDYPEFIKRNFEWDLKYYTSENFVYTDKGFALAMYVYSLLLKNKIKPWMMILKKTPNMIPWLQKAKKDIIKILDDRKNRVRYK